MRTIECPECHGDRERYVQVRSTDELRPNLPRVITHWPRRLGKAVCGTCGGRGEVPLMEEAQRDGR